MKHLRALPKLFVNFIFLRILPFILYFYERFIMYRIKEAWGTVHVKNIKNKGKNLKIVGYSRFLDSDNLHIGDNVRIGYNCFFFSSGGIRIGSNTIISRNVTIYSASHDYTGDLIPFDENYIRNRVTIGSGVWIGMNVNILPGVKIGDGAIIGMGTTIARDVEKGSVVAGQPFRDIGVRDMQRFYDNEKKGNIFSIYFPQS